MAKPDVKAPSPPDRHWDEATQSYVTGDPNWQDKPKTKPQEPPVIEPIKVTAVKNARWPDEEEFFTRYPLIDMAVGDGFFVANEDVKGADPLIVMRREIYRARLHYGVFEHDEVGNEVWEDVTVKGQKPDGTLTATILHRPKLLYGRYYSAIAVKKDDEIGDSFKAPSDGVLVIREA